MVELNSTHHADGSTSLDVLLRQNQDPEPLKAVPAAASLQIESRNGESALPHDSTYSPQPGVHLEMTAPLAAASPAHDTSHENKSMEQQEGRPRGRDAVTVHEQRAQIEWVKRTQGFMMVFTMIVISTTYQAGLNPPGGSWQDDRVATTISAVTNPSITYNNSINDAAASPKNVSRRQAGNPILADKYPTRYNIFFISNSITFAYSLGVVAYLMSETIFHTEGMLINARKLLLLNMAFLLFAFSAGCARDVFRSLLPLEFLAFCVIVFYIDRFNAKRKQARRLLIVGGDVESKTKQKQPV
uniref:Uncharacterized protein LOC105045092 n=1 Tax=Elaeis guineensis var. tenera TaxID=51953 RepID=A0A6I9R8I5_ELAGV|nr:uncharacterized protein LOC105045092 [Elaeis guineensis]